ncbi:hypothetical protein C4D60_Mb11t15770 [Musa balbisiana]|uniref:Uncharacterized protein n=1 Tax=Musa balbisiana TaxID=52838 RepID=A0A4S8J4K1_MUSBA|nr:hypothetical protein C4D60_Mb11t15770 [Musa balbisiana]
MVDQPALYRSPPEQLPSLCLVLHPTSWHDVDSVVTEELLGALRDCYCIPTCYGVFAPRPGQWPYDQFPDGFGLTVRALKAGL